MCGSCECICSATSWRCRCSSANSQQSTARPYFTAAAAAAFLLLLHLPLLLLLLDAVCTEVTVGLHGAALLFGVCTTKSTIADIFCLFCAQLQLLLLPVRGRHQQHLPAVKHQHHLSRRCGHLLLILPCDIWATSRTSRGAMKAFCMKRSVTSTCWPQCY
jgi:hypothetical protein